jgi:hypothetical protein
VQANPVLHLKRSRHHPIVRPEKEKLTHSLN